MWRLNFALSNFPEVQARLAAGASDLVLRRPCGGFWLPGWVILRRHEPTLVDGRMSQRGHSTPVVSRERM